MDTINIAANPENDTPNEGVKRKLGAVNAGLYCNECNEFFAVAICKPDQNATNLSFKSNGDPMFECSMCGHKERRQPSEIAVLILTEELKRRH